MASPDWPAAGAFRVGNDPAAVPNHRRHANRWDHPQGHFVVRYLASALRGSMVELLARFRYDDEAEELIAAVEGVEPDDEREYLPRETVADWLAKQKVARCALKAPGGLRFVNVNDPVLLAKLDRHERVRAVLDAQPPTPNAAGRRIRIELDGSMIRSNSELGRAVTQTIASVLYDDSTDVLIYASRLDDNEICWAVYNHVEVAFTDAQPLAATNPQHRGAVQSAAKLFGLELPDDWRLAPDPMSRFLDAVRTVVGAALRYGRKLLAR